MTARIFLAAALFLAGPGAHAQEEAKAWIVFSVAKDINYAAGQLRLRHVGSDKKYLSGFSSMSWMKGEMQDFAPGKTGRISVLDLPAGQYEIINYRLEFPASNTVFSSRNDFSVKFDAKPGEVTYLGEFLATGVMTKAFLGLRNVDKPYFIVSDQRERDLAIAIKQTPEVNGLPVTQAQLRPSRSAPFTTKRMPNPEEKEAPKE
jgi:hypothetical protein